MIIERPRESTAFCANSRPIRSAAAAGTPVISSCQAGVHGGVGSSYPVGHVARQPVAADAVVGQQQVEHGGHQPSGDAPGGHAAAHQRADPSARVEAAGSG